MKNDKCIGMVIVALLLTTIAMMPPSTTASSITVDVYPPTDYAVPTGIYGADIVSPSRSTITASGVPHVPIRIEGNADFTSANGVLSGSGTDTDPYIISGWYIDANDGEYAISISNTDAHAIIRDCTLWNASTHTLPYGHGLTIQNVKNLTVDENHVFRCYTGIFVKDSDDNVFRGNTLNDTTHTGLQLYSNNNRNLIDNNTIYSIAYDGVCLWGGSNNNNLTGNWIHSNTFCAVNVREGDGNIIYANLLENNQYGVEVYYSYAKNLTVEMNTIQDNNCGVMISGDGHAVRDNLIRDCTYGIYLYQCNHSVVEHNWMTYCGIGVWGREARDDSISRNNITECAVGVQLDGSTGCTISYNIFGSNNDWGVYLDGLTSSNMIVSNEFWYNAGATKSYDDDTIQAFDDGSENRWNDTDSGNFWCDWDSPDYDGDGIVDDPYKIAGEAEAVDSFPLTGSSANGLTGTILTVVFTAIILVATFLVTRKWKRQP